MSGNATLRKKLDALIATTPETYGAAWTALCEEEAHNVLSILGTDPTYNCHAYSLQVNTLPEFKKMGREWDEYETMVSSAFMGKLLDNGVLKPARREGFAVGPVVLYMEGDRVTHSAVVSKTNKRLMSKWGSGRVYEHDLYEVPATYGDKVLVVEAPDPARVMEELKIWVGGYKAA
jgi:hypothetical protein